MKHLFLLIALVNGVHSFAQVSVTEKKGKYTVYSPSGKVLMKKVGAVELFESPEYQNMFAVFNNGFCSVYLNENERDLIPVLQGDYWKVELNLFANNRLVAFDFFNNQYIIESTGAVSDTFDYYNNGLRGGTNNTGKVALCRKNSNITEYVYNSVYRLDGSPGEWFVASTDSGSFVIDPTGKHMTYDGVDQIYASAYYDSLFICEKNDLWSIIDLQGRFKLAPTQLLEPYVEFTFDGASFSDLSTTEAIFQRNGKQGVINMLGDEIIAPKYDVIHGARTFEYNSWGEPIRQLSAYAVKPDSSIDKWIFLDVELSEMISVQEEQFIATKDNYGIFLTADRLLIYDIITGTKVDFIGAAYPARFKLRSPKGLGVADNLGRLILPFKYYRINETYDTEGGLYYIAYTNNRCDLFSQEGVCLTVSLELEQISDVCNAESEFFRIQSANGEGVATIVDGVFKIVIPADFEHLSCFSLDPKKPIATGVKSEKTYNLYRDGRIEIKD